MQRAQLPSLRYMVTFPPSTTLLPPVLPLQPSPVLRLHHSHSVVPTSLTLRVRALSSRVVSSVLIRWVTGQEPLTDNRVATTLQTHSVPQVQTTGRPPKQHVLQTTLPTIPWLTLVMSPQLPSTSTTFSTGMA